MKKILFDASVHFGQFALDNPELRTSCKNSQASIQIREASPIQAYYTYFENGWMDRVIWDLDRELQDAFYPFMDLFYSNKNIRGLADTLEEMNFATMLATKFPNLSSSNAISCALAVTRRIDEVHTLYASLLDEKLVTYMREQYEVHIMKPTSGAETPFENDATSELEARYQIALKGFEASRMNLLKNLHDDIAI
jgi:hypothetical protein